MKCQKIAIVALTTVGFVQGLPRYDISDKGIPTSKRDYFTGNVDQVAMESVSGVNATEKVGEVQDRPPRFGFPTYSHDVQSVNNVAPGLYGPVKLDIGGLVLGTIVGLGAFFILPKLFHVVSTPYGGYKRSEDEINGISTMGALMSSIQAGLEAYNIDSNACLQRAICFSIQSASGKTENKTVSTLMTTVDNIAKNDIVKALINGTEWKTAVDVAEKDEDCNLAFPKCPVEVDAVISVLAKYLSS